MQDCLSFGKPLLIENIEEELDPVLDPVLERRYVKKGRGFTVALADKEVCPLQQLPPCLTLFCHYTMLWKMLVLIIWAIEQDSTMECMLASFCHIPILIVFGGIIG